MDMQIKKIINCICLFIAIAVLLYVVYGLYIHVTTGRPMSKLPTYYLLLTVPVGIWRVVSIRRSFSDSSVERKKFNKIVLRSVLIAILIVSLVVIATALYAINRTPQ